MLKNTSLLTLTGLALASCGNSEKPLETETTKTGIPAAITEFKSSEIMSGKLSGTFIDAGENSPVILIVPGSGPTSKDGAAGGMQSNAYKFLAEDLALAGISSARVDKRGMFSSAAAGDPNDVTIAVYAEDYRSWAKTLQDKTGQDCVYLLGHSEGGLMVTAAAQDQENICGVILIAAPGRRPSDVIREQLNANPANAPILSDAETALNALENGQTIEVSKFHPALQGLFNPAVQEYLISLFSVDPADLLAALDIPKLIIQGDNDIQVSVADAERLANKSGGKLIILKDINHVLKSAPRDRMGNIGTYNSPNTPIDPAVAQAIASFISN